VFGDIEGKLDTLRVECIDAAPVFQWRFSHARPGRTSNFATGTKKAVLRFIEARLRCGCCHSRARANLRKPG